jgi:hypothetical protein
MPTTNKDFNEELAMKRREAYLIMRAMDSCIWADPQDEQAMRNIALRLWNSGRLAALPLTETMLDMLPSAQQKQYRRTMGTLVLLEKESVPLYP